jgi:alpha-beta hydrolase superfamily lysophospholipase
MQLTARLLALPDGPCLFVRQVTPRQPWARCVWLHGAVVHGEYALPFALSLAEAGVEVFLPDLRGHGRSDGPRGHLSHPQQPLADVAAVLALASGDLPVWVGGESYGGLLGYLVLTHTPGLAGAVLSAPAFALRAKPSPRLARWLDALGRWAPRAYLPVSMSLRGVSRYPHLEALARRDPLLVRQYTVGFYRSLRRLMEEAAAAPPPSLPVLALLGQGDAVTDNAATRALLSRAPMGYVREYAHALHAVTADAPEAAAEAIAFLHRFPP